MSKERTKRILYGILPFFLVAVVICSSGCNKTRSDLPEMKGKVTLDGTPLENGNITFSDSTGGSWSTAVKEDGSYALNVPAGDKFISITATRPIPGTDTIGRDGSPMTVFEQIVPKKYNTASTLSYKVETGKNKFDVDLDSK